MKILHMGDLHFRNDLLEEIEKCIDSVVKTAESSRPDMIVIAGDVFDEKQPYDSPAFLSAYRYIRRFSEIAPVLIVKGTPSHDGQTLKFFENERVYVSEIPEQVFWAGGRFVKSNGVIPAAARILFSCMPSVSKAAIAGMRDSLSETNFTTVELIRDVLRGWGEVNARMEIPKVLVGHMSVLGADLSTGQQLVGREVELSVGDLRLSGVDLVCLGHIHKVQNWGEVYYSGSITRLNFGEVEDKGFWLHRIESGKVSSEFIKTPAREMVTLDLLVGLPTPEALEVIPSGSLVRLRYQVTEEDVHKVNEKSLLDRLTAMGAVEVKIEKTIIPKQRIRASGISALVSLEDKLRKWAEVTGIGVPAGVFTKLAMLDGTDEISNSFSESIAV